MKSVYERLKIVITEFDTDDVIVTSGISGGGGGGGNDPLQENVIENAYFSAGFLQVKVPSDWFS